MSVKKSLKLGFKQLNFNLTQRQEEFLNIMMNEQTRVVFLTGPSGVSKSFLAVYAALKLFNQDSRKRILYLRSAIESGEKSIGLLPGTLQEKFQKYEEILFEKIEEILEPSSSLAVNKSFFARAEPINFLRGKTFIDLNVILDEANNCSSKEILTVMTRIGLGSKLFILGDKMQCDIKNSGLTAFMQAFNNQESKDHGIHCMTFDKDDIVRDELIKFILFKYEENFNV